jgi:hypothetical protein
MPGKSRRAVLKHGGKIAFYFYCRYHPTMTDHRGALTLPRLPDAASKTA